MPFYSITRKIQSKTIWTYMSVILNVSSRVLVMALISNLGWGALFAFDLHWYTLIHTTLEKCVRFYLLLQLLCKLGQLFFASLVIDLHPIGIFAPTLFRVNIYHDHTIRMYQEYDFHKRSSGFFCTHIKTHEKFFCIKSFQRCFRLRIFEIDSH